MGLVETVVTHLSLFLVQLILAAVPILAKIAFIQISPWSLAWIRVTLAAMALLAWFFVVSQDRVKISDYLRLAILSVFGVCINQFCYMRGLSLTTAINSTIILGMIPVFTFVIAIVLRRELNSLLKTCGVILSFVGVFVLAGPNSISFSLSHTSGNVLLLMGGGAYAVYLVLVRDIIFRYHLLTVVTWIFTFGSLIMFPFAWSDVVRTDFLSLSLLTWGAIVFLSMFASILAYFLTGFALKRASSTLVAVYICLQPVLVAFMAVFVLQESISWEMVFAGSLIFAGVILSASEKPPAFVES